MAASVDETTLERDAEQFAHWAGPALAGALPAVASSHAATATLPAAAAETLRRDFAIDASAVRLHTDAGSAATSLSLGARAFTVGSDIFFGGGQYRPNNEDGRHLLAHELAHVGQQRRFGVGVQRSPYGGTPGTADLHDRLSQDYADESPGNVEPPQLGGVQYTEGYRQWMRAQGANGVQFLPTTFTQKDPMQQPVSATGLTTYSINGQPTAGLRDLGTVISTIQGQLTPTTVVHAPGLVTGQVQCRFDPAQRIESSTHVDELTPPPRGGWTAPLPPAAVGAAAVCPGKATVPVTLTDVSGNPATLATLVHDSELEHVAELRALHDRHFAPYYRVVLGLTATSGSEAGCEARIRPLIADRDAQAATAFALGDLAATRRYDDPASTHHGVLTPSVSPGCTAVTLTARQVNPPQPGSGPGNVMPVAPIFTAVDPTLLSVSCGRGRDDLLHCVSGGG